MALAETKSLSWSPVTLAKAYLKEHGIEKFKADFKLHGGIHPSLPLVVFNYHPYNSPKNDVIVEQCRGIVFELDTWDIVAQGLDRFYNHGEKGVINTFKFENNTRLETKEDGTLLHMYYYKKANQWILSNRYNFCEDIIGLLGTKSNIVYDKMTYQDLFENICKKKINELGEHLDKNITYCLEMCSINNAIIKIYKEPKIYLLAAFTSCNENKKELSFEYVDHILDNNEILWHRPKVFRADVSNNLTQVYELMHNISLDDPMFEGFVLVNSEKKRLKIKSPLYKIVHGLKYRGLPYASKNALLPFIKNNNIDLVLENLAYFRNENEMREIIKRVDIIKKSPDDENNQLFLDINHPSYYCKLLDIPDIKNNDTGMATIRPRFENNEWSVFCYCNHKMDLIPLRIDYVMYKTCHCGSRFDYKKYPVGTLLYLCSKCGTVSHEAHQKEMIFKSGEKVTKGQPTGIPASDELKNLRLHIHQIINELMKKFNVDKDAVYNKISNILGLERHKTHMGLFDYKTCYYVISELQKILDNNKFEQ